MKITFIDKDTMLADLAKDLWNPELELSYYPSVWDMIMDEAISPDLIFMEGTKVSETAEAVSKLKSLNPDSAIIVYSPSANDELRNKVVDAGATGFTLKNTIPFLKEPNLKDIILREKAMRTNDTAITKIDKSTKMVNALLGVMFAIVTTTLMIYTGILFLEAH